MPTFAGFGRAVFLKLFESLAKVPDSSALFQTYSVTPGGVVICTLGRCPSRFPPTQPLGRNRLARLNRCVAYADYLIPLGLSENQKTDFGKQEILLTQSLSCASDISRGHRGKSTDFGNRFTFEFWY